MRRAAATTVACAMACAASAQASSQPAPFSARLEQARTVVRVDANSANGPGAAVLKEAIDRAKYVLIGEDHLSREIPQFATAVCRMMAPHGLRAFAVEIGPEAAWVINGALRAPDRTASIAAFMRAHPDAIAFQNGSDESDMAAACAGLAGPRFEMWGLDQEFFGASGYLIEQMLAARPGPVARAAIEKLSAIDRTTAAAALASGSPGDLLIYKATDREIADAGAAIARDGGARVKELFAALVNTRAIYLGQNTDGYASNGQRALLMKRTLMRYMATDRTPGRVLFKFGDVHMAKGVNGLGQRDLGNFVAERAEGEGASSLHIAVYGTKGVHALYAGVGRQVAHEPFVMADDPDYAWLKDALALRDRAGAGKEWMLIDLRPLRARPPSDMGQRWRNVAQHYDLLVIAPDLTPSSLLGAR